MDYSKLAEGIFSALGSEEAAQADVENDIANDADSNVESPSIKSSLLSSKMSKGLAALSVAGMATGLLGTAYAKVKGITDASTAIYTVLGVGVLSGVLLLGRGMTNHSAERSVKQAESLVRATERYIRRQAEQQELEAEAEAEAERAAEQTKAAQTFFTDTKTGMGLGIDFSNPMNLSSAMGNIGDFNASSGRNSGVVLRPNHSAEKFKWL